RMAVRDERVVDQAHTPAESQRLGSPTHSRERAHIALMVEFVSRARPPLFPPAAVLTFGAGTWLLGGERAVEREFAEDRVLWRGIRRRLMLRHPHYPGLQDDHHPMTRDHYRRYRDRYGIDDEIFERLRDA